MKLLKGWKVRLLAGLAAATTGGQLEAQMMPGSPYPNAMGPGGAPMMFASYPQDAGIAPAVGMDPSLPSVPLTMGGDCTDPGMLGECGCGPDGACGCGPDGGCGGICGGTCGACLGGGLRGRLAGERTDIFGRSLTGFRQSMRGAIASKRGFWRPYGEGGVSTQRWFDLSAEVVTLSRTKGAAGFALSSDGVNGPRVLNTNSVDFDKLRAGLGVQGNIQTGPGSNLEVVYFGLNRWNENASVTSNTPRYFSFISNFGQLPANGFDDSDRSLQHAFNYQSELHNGEINFRRRWAEPYGFWQGSFLGGVRYLDIDESGAFTAVSLNNNGAGNNGPRFFDYTVNTQNSLVGFQLGGDLWYNLIPGVKLGAEVKSGVFNNQTAQITSIRANSLPNPINEQFNKNEAAYVSQLSAQLYYRLNYSLALRSSWQLMYVDGISLAADNFNATPPALFLPGAARNVTINNDSEVVYQGFTLGGEYTW